MPWLDDTRLAVLEEFAEAHFSAPPEQQTFDFARQLNLDFCSARERVQEDRLLLEEDVRQLSLPLRLRSMGRSYAQIARVVGSTKDGVRSQIEREMSRIGDEDRWRVLAGARQEGSRPGGCSVRQRRSLERARKARWEGRPRDCLRERIEARAQSRRALGVEKTARTCGTSS
jgi:hypothetical protein